MTRKFKDLITSVDVLNTLHGGVSEAIVSVRESDEGREMKIRVPGMEREALQVEIINSELSIYYLIPILSSGDWIHLPQIVYSQKIPHFVKSDGINAHYDQNQLVVNIPFNTRSNGENRKVEIKK